MTLHDPVLAESIRTNRCPDCGNFGFLLGPRAGSARNIFCAKPTCRSGFNVTPRGGQVLFCNRIAKSGEERYPPRVHVLAAGHPLCRFTAEAPIDWPIGHCWLARDEIEDPAEITCPVCHKATAGRIPKPGEIPKSASPRMPDGLPGSTFFESPRRTGYTDSG
jgi:hypothetical protein